MAIIFMTELFCTDLLHTVFHSVMCDAELFFICVIALLSYVTTNGRMLKNVEDNFFCVGGRM